MSTRSTLDTRLVKRGHTKNPYDLYKLKELKKCIQDPIYFSKNYVKIQHPIKGQTSFELYPFQEDLINLYHQNRFSIALLPRQSGKCCISATQIKIRNKKTGEMKEISMKEFYNLVK